MITAQDEFFQDKGTDPMFNESGWFSLQVPERGICGWAYLHHRPNMNYTVGGLALWDGNGSDSYDCVYYNWGDPFPIGEEMFDFKIGNGFEIECVEPLKQFHIQNHTYDCDADLTWTAFMPPVEPGFPIEWGAHHYEQAGRMRGTIEVEGETLEVDCFSCRDRSWGPRTVNTVHHPRSGFPWAVASEDLAWLIFPIGTNAAKEDPAYGEEDTLCAGWYWRDGKAGIVQDGYRRIPERGEDGRPLVSQVAFTDEHGRSLEAEGAWGSTWKWHGHSFTFEWWALVEWQFEGMTVMGEDEEFWPRDPARHFLRKHLPQRTAQPA